MLCHAALSRRNQSKAQFIEHSQSRWRLYVMRHPLGATVWNWLPLYQPSLLIYSVCYYVSIALWNFNGRDGRTVAKGFSDRVDSIFLWPIFVPQFIYPGSMYMFFILFYYNDVFAFCLCVRCTWFINWILNVVTDQFTKP